jgi:hypothetical protein
MQRKFVPILAFVLISTLACQIYLVDTPPPAATQVIVVPANTATNMPIQPTQPIPPPEQSLPTPYPTYTPFPTWTSAPPPATATLPGIASATLIKNAMCRKGPSQAYDAVTSFYTGQVLEIVGRSPDVNNTWWLVIIPGTRSSTCWISLVTAQAVGNFDDIPFIYPPY